MAHVEFRSMAQRNLRIGKAEIGIKEQDFFALGRQGNSQVYRDGCLADTAFAAGHTNDFGLG